MQPPASGTVQRWCWDLVCAESLEAKLRPPATPPLDEDSSWERDPPVRALVDVGRPPELKVVARASKTPKPGALRRPEVRAALMHTFLHHELQAAELFAAAVLRFPETPRAFRAGLVGLCREELGHLALYARHIDSLGSSVGDFGVRDWFWERGQGCDSPAAFLAFVGLGLEGANLEHTARFAAAFRAAGDEAGAALQEHVGRDEERHVAFAAHWFRQFEGELTYERWAARLPAPLTPTPLRGLPLNRAARRRAGMAEDFLDRLEQAPPVSRS